MQKKGKKYWILFTIFECPPCGRTHEYRTRRYTPKPKDSNKRYEWHQHYDGCLG